MQCLKIKPVLFLPHLCDHQVLFFVATNNYIPSNMSDTTPRSSMSSESTLTDNEPPSEVVITVENDTKPSEPSPRPSMSERVTFAFQFADEKRKRDRCGFGCLAGAGCCCIVLIYITSPVWSILFLALCLVALALFLATFCCCCFCCGAMFDSDFWDPLINCCSCCPCVE